MDTELKGFSVPDTKIGLERVGYDKTEPVYEYKGFRFIKYNAVRSKSKYRDQYHLPVMEVCGVKFAALECVKAGEGYIIY